MQPGAGGAHYAGVHPSGVPADGAARRARAVGAPPHPQRHPRPARRHAGRVARHPLPLPAGNRGPRRRAGRRPALAGRDRPAGDPPDGQRAVHLVEPGQPPALPRPEEDGGLRRAHREARRIAGRRAARPLLLRGADPRPGVQGDHVRHRLPHLGARAGVARTSRLAAGLPLLRRAQRAVDGGAAARLLPLLHPAVRAAPLRGQQEGRRGVLPAHGPGRRLPRGTQRLRSGARPRIARVGAREGGLPGQGRRLPPRTDRVASGAHDYCDRGGTRAARSRSPDG